MSAPTCPTCGRTQEQHAYQREFGLPSPCRDAFHSQPAPSRSIARRLAAQKGEPVPEFTQQAPSQSAEDALTAVYVAIDGAVAAARREGEEAGRREECRDCERYMAALHYLCHQEPTRMLRVNLMTVVGAPNCAGIQMTTELGTRDTLIGCIAKREGKS